MYRCADDFKQAGIFKGGLDVGVDPNLLQVNLNSEENLLERMKSPFSPQMTIGQTSSQNLLDASIFGMGGQLRHPEMDEPMEGA